MIDSEKKQLFSDEETAFDTFSKLDDFDNAMLIEVDVSEEKWAMTQVSWKEIAKYLARKKK